MINHSPPKACLGEYMSPLGGSLWEIAPPPPPPLSVFEQSTEMIFIYFDEVKCLKMVSKRDREVSFF